MAYMGDTTLGKEIKRLRNAADVTLRELARRVGVTAAHLSDIEHDRRRPSEELLRGIARELAGAGADYERLKLLDRGLDADAREIIRRHPAVGEMLREMEKSGRSPLDIIRDLQRERDKKNKKPDKE